MPDEKQNQDPGQQSEPPVYASPVKRALGMGGNLLYAHHPGHLHLLSGHREDTHRHRSSPLLPRAGGAGSPPPYCAIAPAKGGADPVACAVLTALCAVLLLLNLGIGIPALLRNFGG